jgi:hypothetical protein
MSDFAQIAIERDVVDAAAERAAEQGLSVSEYISLLLRRSFERLPDEESVLVYDHANQGEGFDLHREAREDDEAYKRRAALYGNLFGCS